MSSILNLQGDTPTGERRPKSERPWNKLRRNIDITGEEMAQIAIKYPPLQDGLINPGEDRWDIENDPITGEPIKYDEHGIGYTDSTRNSSCSSAPGLDWGGNNSDMVDTDKNFWNNDNNNSNNNNGGNGDMNIWAADQTGYGSNTNINNGGEMNWGINPNQQQTTRRDRRDRRNRDYSQSNVSDDVKSDLAELAKWSKETTPNIKVNGNLNDRDQEAIVKAFEKLSVKGLKKIAEALDEDEYSALQTIMTIIGFGDQFTSATVGANPLALDQKTIIKMFKELKDVIDSDGRADDMRTLKFTRLTQKLVAGESIKSDDVYEMLNDMIESGVINPKRIGTDPTKTHLIVCINKAEEWLNKKSGDFGGAYGAYDIGNQWTTSDTNSYSYGAVGASNDVWGSTTSSSSAGDGGYYDSLNSRRSRRKNNRNNDGYGYDLTPDYDYGAVDSGIDLTNMSMNNMCQGDYDPVLASVRERDRREGVVRRDRRYQSSSRNDSYAAAYQPYSGSADDFITL